MADGDNLFKVVIIGDSGVGKSNLMMRYCCNEFSTETPSTIGVEFQTKSVKCDNRHVKVQIWDTAGQERFRAISRSIYHGAKGAMLVYDITNQASFDSLSMWLNELRCHVHQSTVIFLIGNKSDLEHLRVIKKETADRFARENGLSFLETSAAERTNVDKAFDWLVKSIHDQTMAAPNNNEEDRKKQPVKLGKITGADIGGPKEPKKSKGGCEC